MRTATLWLLVSLLGLVAMATATTVAPTTMAASEGPSATSGDSDSATNVHVSFVLMAASAIFYLVMRQ